MSKIFDDLFVFEMANNHEGDVVHGLNIIKAMSAIAQRFGIRAAVKLQYRDLGTFIHPAYTSRDDVKHLPRFRRTRLSKPQSLTFIMATRDAGMVTMVTPFDEPSVDLAMEHGVDVIKVASCSATDWPLLEVIAATGRPIICSTGGRTRRDIDRVVNFFEHRKVRDFALLHCVGIYPTPNEQLQLGFLAEMMNRYRNLTIGYSGHEAPDNLDAVKVAVAMGARILERHVGIATDKHKLNSYSMTPEQASRWVEAALTVRKIRGGNGREKIVSEVETRSLSELARGAFARRDIKAGEALSRDAVYFAAPILHEDQTTSGEYLEIMVASRDYPENEPLLERRPVTPLHLVREVVHDAKGLLLEAGIIIGDEYTIELSHHFGMDRFRRVGAVIVNLINREYCKKLLVMLPGQKHPTHHHKLKEETFQVLWGDLDVNIDGQERSLRAGAIQLIGRGQRHCFSSKGGCIFEEISTTHVDRDSYYDDPIVASLDPIQRKTFLESW